MNKNRRSITITVIVGYLLLTALAAFAVLFIYSQVIGFTSMAEENLTSNNRLVLVGRAATNLYEAESLSRQLIQTGDTGKLEMYKSKIDTIRHTLDSLKRFSINGNLTQEIDSINLLLNRKIENLEELLELRAREGNQSYYSKVISELERVDESFGSPNYEERFKDLAPHQRRVLVQWLEYAERDNAQQITNKTLDSLVRVVRNVLSQLEVANRRFQETVRETENELLANEINLNSQLRNLLSTIEAEERQLSLSQVSERQEIVTSTSRTIAILGAVSFLVILIFLFLVIRDVTRSRRYRTELENAKQYAESLLKSREQFMATVTHDLRSPLSTVVGYTDLLEKTNLDRSQTHYLNHVKKSSDFILHLVNDLLDLSKLEAGKMSVENLAFNPKNLIEDTVENTIPAEKSKKVSVKVELSKDLDRMVKSDPFRIKQILVNLVTNACKFTEEGTIEITAFLKTRGRTSEMVIKVKDTGIGISEEKKETIFEEFSQEDNSIEKRFGGSGLGLAISKKLTHILNGSIELESESGKGSEFTLRIPVKLVDGQKTSPSKTSAVTKKELSRFTVLAVDDEPAQLGLISELVKTTGMAVDTSNNGQEALKKLETKSYDLVLTDIQMPEMDGFELLSYIRSDSKKAKLPVIAISGKSDTSPEEYLEIGFNGSLLKPYSSSHLIQMIEEVLETELTKPAVKMDSKRISINYSLSEVELFAGGDKQALNSILMAFVDSTRANLAALNEENKIGNKKRMAEIAHKMLPMFRQLKAKAVVKELEILESPSDERSSAVCIKVLTVQVKKLLQEIEEELRD